MPGQSGAAIGNWYVIASTSGVTMVVRAYQNGNIVGDFTVTVPQTATALSACTWSNSGYLPWYTGIQVLSVTGGNVYVSETLSTVSTSTGDIVTIGSILGIGVNEQWTAANPLYIADAYVAPSTVTWTSATTLNTAITSNINGMDTVVFTYIVSGSITGGVLTFEVYDGANWVPIRVARSNSYNTELTYTLSGGQNNWQIGVAGYQQFRARLSTVISGTGSALLTTIVSSTPDVGCVTVGFDPSQALPAGTNVIGYVQQAPSTSGGVSTTYQNGALTNTAVSVKSSAGNLYDYTIYNPNASAVCVEFFNTSSVTLGSTTPLWHVTIPATSRAADVFQVPKSFNTAIYVAAVTAYNGSTAPGTALDVCIGYN